MGSKLRISYDKEGDILWIGSTPAREGQVCDETDDGMLVMWDGEAGPVESIEIFGFSARFKELGDEVELPFSAVFSAPDARALEPTKPAPANR